MLALLRIRQFAIIDEVEVELSRGLTVVTGETGSGKSILIDALGVVLGGRTSTELVRTGADRADVEALFALDDRELVLRRTVLAAGRSRAYIDGDVATVAQLADAARGLVDISSQHEHHTLVDPATHLGFLDAYAGLEPLRERMGAAVEALRTARKDRDDLADRIRRRTEREDLLRWQLGEIDGLGLRDDEPESLDTERERLAHAAQLVAAAGGAERELYSRDGAVVERLARLLGTLDGAAAIDPELLGPRDAIASAREDLEEAARLLGRYARSLDADPARLEEIEERTHAIRRLVRKYGGTPDALRAHRDAARAELDELDSGEERLTAAEAEVSKAHAAAAVVARELTAARRAAAGRLGDEITGELASLGMGGARVEVDVAPLDTTDGLEVDGGRLTATGRDRVEFLIAPNPGEDPRPLRRVASGGELSRSLLAVKTVLAAQGPVGLYVFDEVDTGVGGAVAEAIGRKLRALARFHQVLCITHLSQIAAYGDQHLLVRKEVHGGRTFSDVRPLTDRERLDELARMLGGMQVTDTTRAAAAELLDTARSASPVEWAS